MSRLPVTNFDYISLSDKDRDFLDVQFHYTIPIKEDVDISNCIVTTYVTNGKNKFYKSFNYYPHLTTDKLNELVGDFAYISIFFKDEDKDQIIKILEKRHL